MPSRAPAGLSKRSGALFRAVNDEFVLGPTELELLRSALVALDRADEAAAVIDAEGITLLDRYDCPKAHPAVDVELRNRALYGRFVAQLGLGEAISTVKASGRGAKPGPRPKMARPKPPAR